MPAPSAPSAPQRSRRRPARAALHPRAAALLAAALATTLAAACADAPAARVLAPRASVAGLGTPGAADADSAPGGRGTPSRGRWTVMVYLAADNNLALDGVTDLGEMERAVAKAAAAAAPGSAARDVRVVVEAEFSPQHLARAGCAGPRCLGLANWNTFRYVVAGRPAGTPGYGPAGPVMDLGTNRDMTRPEELRDFVGWAKREYPADHYLLVVWNHGGGYTGLIADETSAGGRLMTMEELRAALAAAGPVDVVDFDMCLMAGYETLAALQGLADYAVFSEAIVPGAGNEYVSLLGRLLAAPASTPAEVAAAIAETFHASYEGTRSSTTISAYALARYPAFDARLAAFARALRETAGESVPLVRDAARRAQRYEQPGLHDLGHLLTVLATSVDERSALYGTIEALRAAATDSAFRLRSYARTGTSAQAIDVSRSTGLHILVPSGEGSDVIAAEGPGSFDAYRAQLPDREWTRFLADYLDGGRATAVVDQGERRLEAYLVWDPAAVERDADVDFWLVEPDGSLHIPYLGRVTPNGQLTNDSAEDETFFEGWASFRVVARGEYYIIANLYADPQDYRPRYNLAYRFGQDEEFGAYLDEPGRLSMRRSWLDDSTATFEKILDGAYTDLQPVAVWRPTPRPAGEGLVAGDGAALRPSGRVPRAAPGPRLTAPQLAVARRLTAARRLARADRTAPEPADARARSAAARELGRLAPR